MERRLRIRIEHVPSDDCSIIEEVLVDDNTKFVVAKTGILTKFNLDPDYVNFLTDYANVVAVVDIELNKQFKDEIWRYPIILPQHGPSLSAARALYRKYNKIVEVIKVVNHKNKSFNLLVNPTKPGVGTPYRLYVDDQMITEKFYPYNLPSFLQLEENVFLDLPKGTHNIKLESLGNNILKINGFACDDLIMANINVNELSFQIQ